MAPLTVDSRWRQVDTIGAPILLTMTDWKRLVLNLLAKMPQTEVGERCGVAQNTVSDLANGKTRRPSADFGLALVRLHEECLGPAPLARTRRSAEIRR